MIRSITQEKPAEELDQLLDDLTRVFLIGCGTCVTLTHTGGEAEVASMKKKLADKGKLITGDMVLPVACDNMTGEALKERLRNTNLVGMRAVQYKRKNEKVLHDIGELVDKMDNDSAAELMLRVTRVRQKKELLIHLRQYLGRLEVLVLH